MHSTQSREAVSAVGASPFDSSLSVEELAAAISEPSAQDLLALVNRLPSEDIPQLAFSPGSHSWQSGSWAHSGRAGLRTNARVYPKFTSLVCRFINALFPWFNYQAFAFFQNVAAPPHIDPNHAKGSFSALVPLCKFEDGEVYVHSDPPVSLPVSQGPCLLDPSILHQVQPWTGHRAVLAVYSPAGFEFLQPADQARLLSLGFKPPGVSSSKLVMGPVLGSSGNLDASAKVSLPPSPSVRPADTPVLSTDVSDEDSKPVDCIAPALPRGSSAFCQLRPGRLFLDLCAGARAPLSSALRNRGVVCLPIDSLISQTQDLLCDACFEDLLRLAFSGAVALGHASPPSCEYTGGRPRCRSSEHIRGFPDNTPELQLKADTSRAILLRCVQILRAVFVTGGHVTFEQPRNSLAWQEDFVPPFLQEVEADLVVIAGCKFGMQAYKHWLFASTVRPLQQLQGECPHERDAHPSLGNVRDGQRLQETAMFPSELADQCAEICLDLFEVGATPEHPQFLNLPAALKLLPARPRHDFLRASQDGAGIYSVPDWSTPQDGFTDDFRELRHDLFAFFQESDLIPRLRAHVAQQKDEPLLSSVEVERVRRTWEAWFRKQGLQVPIDWSILYHLDSPTASRRCTSCPWLQRIVTNRFGKILRKEFLLESRVIFRLAIVSCRFRVIGMNGISSFKCAVETGREPRRPPSSWNPSFRMSLTRGI